MNDDQYRLPGQRSVSGWRKKQALLLAKAPVLTDERPGAIPGRNFNCRRYEKCLDYAIARDWLGFHCGACEVKDEYTVDELLARSEGAFGGQPESMFALMGEGENLDKDELNLDEAAVLLGTAKNWCVRLGNEGKIKMRKGEGAQPLFERSSLEAFKAAKNGTITASSPATALYVAAPDPLVKIRLLVECVTADVLTRDEAFGKIAALVSG